MDALSLPPDAPLPDDVAVLQAMVRELHAEVARLRAENAELKGKLDQALKHRFGRRSERRRRPRPSDDRPERRGAPHGRTVLPEDLPRREVVHDLTEAEKLCPCCGQPRVCIGEQATEQLDLEPARFFVRRTIKKSYACRHCDPQRVPPEQRLQTAGPAQVGPIAKGLCGPGLLAHVITAKFADHLPLYRQAGQLGRSGVRLAPSTLGDWLAQGADLLVPLVRVMQQRLLLARLLHGDDTPVKLRVAGAERTHKSHLWVYIGDADFPYVVFDFTADYTGVGPQTFLKDYRGYLQADALAQYEALYGADRVKHCCCWAHARRKFVVAADGGETRAETALDLIRQLYVIEQQLPPLLPPSSAPAEQRRQREAERQALRQLQARPVLTTLKQWLEEQRPQALPKSALGQAIGYAWNNWAALERYLEQGYLPIDNNLSERTLRAIAVGRNNWGVFGSETGGRVAAVLYSVVGTCKHLGIDPFVYLREALSGMFALGDKPSTESLAAWLPDRWLQGRIRDGPPGQATAG